MRLARLAIVWLPDEEVWAVYERHKGRRVERFKHLADAGWYVRSNDQPTEWEDA